MRKKFTLKNRIIALALCLLLVVSSFPSNVLAEGFGGIISSLNVTPAGIIPECDCDNESDDISAHADGCARKDYIRTTYIVEKSADEIYADWSKLDEQSRNGILTLMSWDYTLNEKLTRLNGLLDGTVTPETEATEESTAPSEGGDETPSSNGVTVSGEGVPEGAKVTASDLSASVEGAYDIKMYKADGSEWQPIDDGKTVTVSIPVTGVADGSYVDVYHFIDYAGDINGDEEYFSTEGADAATLALLADAIAASDREGYVAVEITEKVLVSGGKANVQTDSFSLFTSVGTPPTEATTYKIEDLDNQTLYVRHGEWFQLTSNREGNIYQTWGVGNAADDGVVNTVGGGGSSFLWWGTSSNNYYVYVNETDADGNTTVGQSFSVTYNWANLDWDDTGADGYTITVEVVDDFDWGNTYITLLPHTADYPAEPSVYSDHGYQFYTNGALGNNKTTYTQYPRTVIDVDALDDANTVSDTNKMVYGIIDTSGTSTMVYLKDAFGTLSDDIMEEYFAAEANKDLKKDNYELIVYAVKHETVGSNSGWYINCKVELTSTFLLSYDYNEPLGFNAIDHIGTVKKPNNKSVATHDADGNELAEITTTVDSGTGMELAYSASNKNYSATFVAWSNNPNANPNAYADGDTVDTKWYNTDETITLTGDTTLYAIWDVKGMTYNSANVEFQKNVVDSTGAAVDSGETEFTFTASDNFAGESYSIYSAAGQRLSTGTFASGAMDFTLKGGQYIVIADVDNDSTAYTITEKNIPNGYSAQNGTTTTITIDTATNVSGEFILDFYNVMETYTITYNLDGGTNNSANPATYTVEDEDFTLVAPTKTGYTFTGWQETDTTIEKGTTGNLTFTAKWEENTFTVTYNGSGGTPGKTSDTKYYTTDLTLASASREGYTFTGWNTQADGTGTTYNTTYNVNADVTLYAQWSANTVKYTVETYTMGLDGEYGTPETKEYEAETGTEINLGTTAPTGFTLDDKSVTSGTVTGNGETVLKLYYIRNQYTVTYKVEGGSVEAPAEATVYYGATYTVADAVSEIGYSFDGWYKGTEKATSFTMPAENVELTGKLTAISYTITYNMDGGVLATGVTNPASYTVESDAITLNNPTKTGYTFAGWTGTDLTEATKTVTIAAGSTGNRSYKATWTANSYTIQFNANGGTGTMADQSATYGQQVALKANTFTREGYTFAGWSETSTGSMKYQNNGTVSNLAETGTVTLYAVWNINSYTVSYSMTPSGVAEGATAGTAASQTANFGAKITLNGPTVDTEWDKTHNFLYWTDGTTTYQQGAEFTIPARNVTMTAVWETMYTVKHVYEGLPNESDQVIPRTLYTTEDTVEALLEGKTGFTSPTAVTKAIAIDGSTVFEYEYTRNEHKVTYSFTSDSQTPTDKTVPAEVSYKYGQTVNVQAAPTEPGYTFSGWTVSGGLSSTFAMPDQDVTITGKWTRLTYSVTYSLNGTTTTDESAIPEAIQKPEDVTGKYYNDKVTLGAPTGIPAGYRFLGWKYKNQTGSSYIAAGAEITLQGNVELVGYIERIQYRVTYVTGFNEISTPVDSAVYYYGQEATLLSIEEKPEDYGFVAWYIQSDVDKTQYKPSDKITVNGDMVIVAIWNPEINMVLYYQKMGNAVSEVLYQNDHGQFKSTYTLKDPADVTGYDFTRWDVYEQDATGDKNVTVSEETVDGKKVYSFEMPNDNVKAIAVYSPKDDAQCPVTYVCVDADGTKTTLGTFASSAGTKYNFDEEYGFTVIDIDGYHPVGKTVGDTVYFKAGYGVSYEIEYARNEHTLSYTGNVSIASVNTAYGLTVKLEAPERDGYIFNGWHYDKDGDGQKDEEEVYNAEATFVMPDSDVEMVAQWTAIDYTVTFALNGDGPSDMPNAPEALENKHIGDIIDMPGIMAPAGYTLTWTVKAGNTTIDPENGKFIMPAGNVTVTGTYALKTYTVTFETDVEGITVASMSYNTESTDVLPSTSRDNFVFKGWKVTTVDQAESSWVVNDVHENAAVLAGHYGNVTLTAQWEVYRTDLTITATTGVESDDQWFIFFINGTAKDGSVIKDLRVTVPANGSQKVVQMPVGDYTIADRPAWSWRQNSEEKSFSVRQAGENSVTINYGATDKNAWLNGYGYKIFTSNPNKGK